MRDDCVEGVLQDEVVDASCMSIRALTEFFQAEIEDAKESELLLSLHLKATMMKVSDPIMFGHAIRVFYADWYEKHGARLDAWGANPNRGLASVLSVAQEHATPDEYERMLQDLEACYENRPWLANRFAASGGGRPPGVATMATAATTMAGEGVHWVFMP